VIVNIILYHLFLNRSGAALAIVVAILWGIVFYSHRQYFSGIFAQRTWYPMRGICRRSLPLRRSVSRGLCVWAQIETISICALMHRPERSMLSKLRSHFSGRRKRRNMSARTMAVGWRRFLNSPEFSPTEQPSTKR